ncbi:acetyl-CoA carboxylase biotin carboxyl carrier protein subunit [Rhizobium sp. Root274]|uniref:acetyl-CoA carboxylase biotin carboxyl carrier protein n=1 Tax=unclassified Rhizobium TaxID=2613769 RepID=UPI000712EE89|nr:MULTISPECIES: acetyl-CoA carboxylase biotin carboxyl carrier protein [unclassified Rhizobium]KQW30820.1 acetyl-CoA carboxylase biotin carboxyl carrier protein subunit [Rhizobium sp. Root1240]KRD32365.1 acetyl-CoA carboxylase biotin carboxyl carrier protein subunit [Rhizobium sp. Root274]
MADKKTGIDQALIRDLANILNDTDLTEIEVEQDDLRIRVSRNGTPVMMPQQMQGYAYQAPAPAAPAAPAAVAAPAAPAGRDLSKAVTAPMVGTVYLSPAPGARPFVEVGATVKEGQTLLIIEAMKTMNQIPSPKSGKVVEIVIDDASPVEYGEPLVIIE